MNKPEQFKITMSYLKTLYHLNYNFSKLPADLKSSSLIVLGNKEFNAKISLLDDTILKAIRESQPYDENVEKLYEIMESRQAQTIIDNNGYNTKRSLYQSEELFTKQTIVKITDIPDGYKIVEIVFDRSKYVFNKTRNWLSKNNIQKYGLPEFEDDAISYSFGNGKINYHVQLDDGITAYLSKDE